MKDKATFRLQEASRAAVEEAGGSSAAARALILIGAHAAGLPIELEEEVRWMLERSELGRQNQALSPEIVAALRSLLGE